jgi:hypothetical protein
VAYRAWVTWGLIFPLFHRVTNTQVRLDMPHSFSRTQGWACHQESAISFTWNRSSLAF